MLNHFVGVLFAYSRPHTSCLGLLSQSREQRFLLLSACRKSLLAMSGSTGGGGVGWQVDLPGLSSLVLSLGSAGLKRFAEAGVDLHTVMCMGEIATTCQASNHYRKDLSLYREEQRKEAQWLYRVVEIGASTNFIADTLLKKRAGENVIALMSSILTVMSETACDNLLLKLFEASATPLDLTPGFGQLRCFRETLMPLARKTLFKDRVFHYHVFARQLHGGQAHAGESFAYESIPDVTTAVQVILSLTKLMQGGTDVIFEYHGLKGAGWVIAYARHVLDLPICILESPLSAVPISGDYRNAKVFVHLFEKDCKCQLRIQGKVQDVLVTRSIETYGQQGWVIDVTRNNVLDSCIPYADPMRKGTSLIASSLASKYTRVLSECFSPPGKRNLYSSLGLINYTEYCLPSIRKKAQKILTLLGFDSVEAELIEPEQYIRVCGSEPYLAAGQMWIQSGLGHIVVERASGQIQAGEVVQGTRLDDTAVKYVSRLLRLVEAACWLSFTDWDHHVRLLSLSFLESRDAWKSCLHFERPLLEIVNKSGGAIDFERPSISVEDLGKASVDITIGDRESWTGDFREVKLPNDMLLAFEHYGLVFVQNTALRQDMTLDACFLHIIPGAILANGENYTKLYSYSDQLEAQRLQTSSVAATTPQESLYKPIDNFQGLSVTTRGNRSERDFSLQQTVLVQNKIYPVPSPGSTSRALRELFVTEACEHQYNEELSVNNYTHVQRNTVGPPTNIIKQGLYLAGSTDQRENELWLQSVDRNPLGQWLAYQTNHRAEFLTILQRDCCLACICSRVEELWKWPNHGIRTTRIIHGRLAEEK